MGLCLLMLSSISYVQLTGNDVEIGQQAQSDADADDRSAEEALNKVSVSAMSEHVPSLLTDKRWPCISFLIS